jgi:hypothetical protein
MLTSGGAIAMWTDVVPPAWVINVAVWSALLGAIAIVAVVCVRAIRDPHPAERFAYHGLKIVMTPEPGTVYVRFRTYSHVLGFVVHREHRFWASPGDARMALWRLHKLNLAWGFVHAALFLALESFGDYIAQKRSIRQQAKRFSSGVNAETSAVFVAAKGSASVAGARPGLQNR